jgi:hypothetical protein
MLENFLHKKDKPSKTAGKQSPGVNKGIDVKRH